MAQAGVFEALVSGRAFVDLSPWRKMGVSGSDAHQWLGDLVSADIDRLAPGRARRSLLLSPTGQVRAQFTVTAYRAGLLLLQDPTQPHAIDRLLERYVLSSDVVLEDLTEGLALFAFPDRFEPPEVDGADLSTPSCLGSGIDVLAPRDRHEEVTAALEAMFGKADMEDVEAWRVFRGVPRFGVDVGEDDLPQEGALENAVSFDKGCFVGQEAVAKVRNLGHPRRVLLHLEAPTAVAPEEPVRVDGTEVGRVTSAVETSDGSRALVQVRWGSRNGPFVTSGGTPLIPLGVGR